MPITLPNLPALSPISPGQLLAWHSTFTGPLPVGSALSVSLTTDSEGTQALGFATIVTTTIQGQFVLMNPKDQWTSGEHALATGANVFVQMKLIEGGTAATIDSGTQEMTWQPSSNAALLVSTQSGGGGQGGLTTEQALQLQQTQESTWPEHLVDTLTLNNLGTGNSDFPINANLTSPVFAVIVRLTAVPSHLEPSTPDGDYWVTTLAVVRIYRGSDVWLRVPIHTSSKMINLWMEGIALGLADAVLSAGWLLNLTLQTTFLPGVSGQVFLMRVP